MNMTTIFAHGFPGGQAGLVFAGLFLLSEVIAVFCCLISFASLLKQSHFHLALSFSKFALVVSGIGAVVFMLWGVQAWEYELIRWDNGVALLRLAIALLALPATSLLIYLAAKKKSQ